MIMCMCLSALIQRLEEDVNVHNYLATEKLPKELEVKRKQVANLEKVANVPALTSQDLEKIKKKVRWSTARNITLLSRSNFTR